MSDLIIKPETVQSLDAIILNCSDVLGKSGIRSIADSLAVLQGVKKLKEFFKQSEIKKLVEDAQDNEAGFLTDRSPEAIWKHNQNSHKKYDLKPYTYDQVLNAIIPLMLEGYALHGNEINIISKRGYRTQAGKYRKIINITDGFMDNVATPAFKDKYAYLRCKAKWKISGNIQTIGYSEEDECLLKIKYNESNYDTIDKIIGLAYSKLYTRVLGRITGQFINEDFVDDPIDITDKVNETMENAKSDFAQAAEQAQAKEPEPEKKPAKRRGRPPKKAKEPAYGPEVKELLITWSNSANEKAVQSLIKKGTFTEGEYNEITQNNLKTAAKNWTKLILKEAEALAEEATREEETQNEEKPKLLLSVQQLKDAYEKPVNKPAFNQLYKEGLNANVYKDILASNDAAIASDWLLRLDEYNAMNRGEYEGEEEPSPEAGYRSEIPS